MKAGPKRDIESNPPFLFVYVNLSQFDDDLTMPLCRRVLLLLRCVAINPNTTETINDTLTEGDSKTYDCSATGEPTPVIAWYFLPAQVTSYYFFLFSIHVPTCTILCLMKSVEITVAFVCTLYIVA
jgi:hypothetical protein